MEASPTDSHVKEGAERLLLAYSSNVGWAHFKNMLPCRKELQQATKVGKWRWREDLLTLEGAFIGSIMHPRLTEAALLSETLTR